MRKKEEIKVKQTPYGVQVYITDILGETRTNFLLKTPSEIDNLIAGLQEARIILAESQARLAEEGQQQLWENV